MQTEYLLAAIAAYLLLVLPGMFLARYLFADKSGIEVFFAGNVLGISLTIFLGHSAAIAGMGSFKYILALEYLVALPLFVAAVLKRKERQPGSYLPLLLVISLVFVSRLIPLFFSELPRGWDPAFHCILAKKIVLEGVLPENWLPFDPSAMNYTLGSHIFIALVSSYSSVPIHQVFKILFPIFAASSALGIFHLCISFTGNRRIGILGVISYSFLANWGSLDYYNWGGLPNVLGMLLFLAVLWSVFNLEGKIRIIAGGVFLAGVYLTHHLSAVAALSVFLLYTVFYFIHHRKLNNTAKAFICITIISLILCSFEILPSLARITSISSTSTLKFFDEPIILLNKILVNMGVLFVILSLAGICFAFQEARSDEQFFPLYWLAALFLGYVGLDYIYRFAAIIFLKQNFTAFTPSRFLTDMAYPLSIISAIGIYNLAIRLKLERVFALMCAVLILCSYPAIKRQCKQDNYSPASPGLIQWAGANTPEGGLLMIKDLWAPYLAWRETFYTPLPASENRNSEYNLSKTRITNLDDAKAFLNRYGKRGYWPLDGGFAPNPKIFKSTAKHQEWRLYEIAKEN